LVNRYYDSATDQFLSIDAAVDETGQPYVYVNDNPLNATDPLGLSAGLFGPIAEEQLRNTPASAQIQLRSALNSLALVGTIGDATKKLLNAVASGHGKVSTVVKGGVSYVIIEDASSVAGKVSVAATIAVAAGTIFVDVHDRHTTDVYAAADASSSIAATIGGAALGAEACSESGPIVDAGCAIGGGILGSIAEHVVWSVVPTK
ncbi:MAG: RHS repeat-associated core domain-containing protein, partial [Acidimicrobiales bacterium]